MRTFTGGKTFTTQLECFPCFVRQALICLGTGDHPEALRHKVVRTTLAEAQKADMSRSPAHFTSGLHRRIRDMLGGDPFAEIKSRYNRIALELYPGLKRTVAESPDTLATAARLAVAGNIIDFGIFTSVDIEGTVARALDEPFAVDHMEEFRTAVRGSADVLYLLDNAGEAVFDRLLIEEFLAMGKRVTVAVKGGPVLNDCTVDDARQTGLDTLCPVVDNASDAVGTILEDVSPEFRALFDRSALVVSKGQGNFETLLGETLPQNGPDIFYLFQSKCEVVSRFLDVAPRAMLVARGGAR
jgi:uncharacterized protein with ATP-grasp and redox domains